MKLKGSPSPSFYISDSELSSRGSGEDVPAAAQVSSRVNIRRPMWCHQCRICSFAPSLMCAWYSRTGCWWVRWNTVMLDLVRD